MNDSTLYQYSWKIGKQSELPNPETLPSEDVAINTDVSMNELPSCETERNDTASSDGNALTDFSSSPTFSPNDELEELERSVIDMERYVDELQFELLKFRQADEAKRTSLVQKSPPFEEFLKDLHSIIGSLEAHKTDYALVADTQTENVKLRERLLKLTNENEQLRNKIDELKQTHENELKSIQTANDEKIASMRKEYEEKLEWQAKEFNQIIEKERAGIAMQREIWNEEKATLLVEHASELAAIMKTKDQKSVQEEEPDFRAEIMRQERNYRYLKMWTFVIKIFSQCFHLQINEVQNQAQVQVAQLQDKIERLLMNSRLPGRLSEQRSSFGGQPPINQRPPQPTEIAIQKLRKTPVNSAVVQPQAQDGPLGIGKKQAYFPQSTETAAEIVKNKSLKVAAVPPVLVMSEGPHPLLDNSSNSSGGKRGGDFVELSNSKLCKSGDLMAFRYSARPSYFQLAPMNTQKIDVMPTDEWFDFTQPQAHFEGIEEQNQGQVPGDLQVSMHVAQPQSLQPQQQTVFGSKKRHLFTVHSGNS
ncbi:unnamed protein product [Hymenolepis diminuta]|uniref:Uncharacterized protein n=1 Tax=Hymenolepis diminuta TaxID=6216 RepID=A0A564Y5A6_HYMDI|nr:unnamed protein product [Hymenolepis diminuta]